MMWTILFDQENTICYRVGIPKKGNNSNHINYNGGHKGWNLSVDISKARDASPPTPSKVEFCAKQNEWK